MADKFDNLKDLFENMVTRFNPEKAAGVNAVYQFNLTGEGGGQWYMTVSEGKCEVAEGTAGNPTCTITATAEDYLKIGNGELNATAAFMQGKLKIDGDMGAALKLQVIFGL